MGRQLQAVVAVVFIVGLFALVNQQRGMTQHAPLQENPELVRALRVRLADADARALSAEAKSSLLEQRVRKLGQHTSTATAGVSSAASSAGASIGVEQVQYIHTTTSLPAKRGDLMMMTYATGGVREMLTNWVKHVQRLGLPELVAAMDKDVVSQCDSEAFHCLNWSHTATGAACCLSCQRSRLHSTRLPSPRRACC